MPVKIRLQRHGKKGKPFYHIVVADSRTRRDGKSIDKLGTYNPITNPATITLDVDAAVSWLEKGAQPTDTAKAILSYKGALLKKHLKGGVAKGAFDEAEMEKRFAQWLEEKEKSIQQKVENLAHKKAENKKVAFEAEQKVNEARTATPIEEVVVESTPEAEETVAEISEEITETPASEETSTEENAQA